MKQVTGKTNRSESSNVVSIQLKLGGHSFSEDTLAASIATQTGGVEFVVLTHKTLLVPHEEFATEAAEEYLRLAGLACGAQEMAVWSDPQDGIVAVMAADAACVTWIRAKLAERASFSSPLLSVQCDGVPVVRLCHTEGLLYIMVSDSALRFAEVVRAASEADVIYYIEQLSKEFRLAAFTASVSGEGGKAAAKTLRTYFQRVVCE